MRKPISQREARRLYKELVKLRSENEARRRAWSSDYPGGVHLITFTMSDLSRGSLGAAQRLGHPLVAKVNGNELYVYAVK